MNPGFLSPSQLAPLLLAATEGGDRAAVFMVVSHPDPKQLGGRVLFCGGEATGSFQDSRAHARATTLAKRAISGDLSVLPGLQTLPLEGAGEILAYLELHHPSPELVIVGAGHIAQPMCTLGALLGLRVRVLDDRPGFATRERFPEAHDLHSVDFSDPFAGVTLHPWSHLVLVTRGHRYDYECLRKVLMRSPLPGYIGMISSRRRARATFDALRQEGIEPELLLKVHTPIGLDIGAQTPAEIAVSVAAEIVHLWRGGSCRPLQETEGVLERTFGQEGP